MFAPLELRIPHTHSMDEWAFVISGQVQFYVYAGGNNYSISTLGPGDLMFAPRGRPHYLYNPSGTVPLVGYFVVNSGTFTNFELVKMLGTVEPAVAAASFGANESFMATIDYQKFGVVPVNTSLVY